MRLYHRLKIEGIMPERAILRLKRAGIPLYSLKKVEKTVILLRVERKDVQKVFTMYPKLCYNNSTPAPYTVTDLGEVGLAKTLRFCRERAGLLLGALAFAVLTLAADRLVLGVDVVGYPAYARECRLALAEQGVKPYRVYPTGKEELVTAKLLSLPGVEFCSVQKIGNRVRVEIRYSPLTTTTLQKEGMYSIREGTLVELTVLRGTPLKKAGESVSKGEPLVGNWFSTEEGGQVSVEPIARARIACVYEEVFNVENEERALAEGYLALNLTAEDEIVEWTATKAEEGYLVKISYLCLQKVNL